MSLTIDHQFTPPDLRNAEQKTDARLRAINVRGSRELLKIARRVVHVQSGRLQGGLVADGPFNIATGTLEARIHAPSVPYAGEEVKRGGEHDFPARTLEEATAALDAIARDMEQAIIDVMEGR